MKVLVACEFSGIVRNAFRNAGHDAYSCDLLPSEDDGPYHIQGDVRLILNDGWDQLIAHPTCTKLTNSNVYLYRSPNWKQEVDEAVKFFKVFLDAPIPRIAVENPIMRHAVERVGRKPDQIIQPWMFGHGEIKATCLWLKGLPRLTPTQIVDGRTPRVHHASPGPNRWKERSRTLTGIANAMADQWGSP